MSSLVEGLQPTAHKIMPSAKIMINSRSGIRLLQEPNYCLKNYPQTSPRGLIEAQTCSVSESRDLSETPKQGALSERKVLKVKMCRAKEAPRLIKWFSIASLRCMTGRSHLH
jgi:hypothetical protein